MGILFNREKGNSVWGPYPNYDAIAPSEYGRWPEFFLMTRTDEVPDHDFYATAMHLLGVDREKLIYRSQGRDSRLTDVAGKIM